MVEKPGRRRQRLVAGNAAPLACRKGRQHRRRDPEGICQRDPGASGPPLHLGRSGCGGGFGPRARPRFKRRSFRWSTSSTSALDKVRAEHPGYEIAVTGLSAIAARNSANMIEKLNHGLTIEFAAGRDLHRAGIPLGRGDVLLHPARHFPGGGVGHGAVDAGRGAAIRQRGRADGVVRPRPERDDPLPQPAAAGEQAGRQLRRWRSSAPPCWSVRR